MLITSNEALSDLVAAVRTAGYLALDTEFVQERSYFPRLGIVQVASAGVEAIVDTMACPVEPVVELLLDPAIEVIVHSGRMDFDILCGRSGSAPTRVYDTQLAAALVGLGDMISYGKLVDRTLGIKLAKLHSRTDWTRRPLSRDQIEYALDDVRHLPAVRARIDADLDALDRNGWARELFAELEDPTVYGPPDPTTVYRRVRGAAALDERPLAILREIAAWREAEAMARDVPRQRIMRDDVLIDIARRRPGKAGDLREMRFLDQREAQKNGAAILDAVRRGAAAPPCEALPAARLDEGDAAGVTGLLEAWLLARSVEARIAPRLVATRADLEVLAVGNEGDRARLPLLRGWRFELVGKELVELLDGRKGIAVDPATHKLTRVDAPRR